MAHERLSHPGNESPGHYVPAGDASTQTKEGFILSEPIRNASTQTTEDDFDFLSRIHSTMNIPIPISESIVDTSESVQVENPVEMQSIDVRDEKIFVCKVCDKDLNEHAEKRGTKNGYICCVCSYTTCRRASLTQHIDFHRAKNICNICTREYTEGDPHSTENTCNVCARKNSFVRLF